LDFSNLRSKSGGSRQIDGGLRLEFESREGITLFAFCGLKGRRPFYQPVTHQGVSSMLLLVLLIGSVLVIVGAFMWIKPSPRDQHLNLLRSKAIQEGFKLDSIRVPDTSIEGRLAEKSSLITLYRLLHRFEKGKAPRFTVQRTTGVSNAFLPDGWKWADTHRPSESVTPILHDMLVSFPERYLVIDAQPDGVGLVWDERDDASALPAIRETLERLISQLSA
jgi:hypothetical protein